MSKNSIMSSECLGRPKDQYQAWNEKRSMWKVNLKNQSIKILSIVVVFLKLGDL